MEFEYPPKDQIFHLEICLLDGLPNKDRLEKAMFFSSKNVCFVILIRKMGFTFFMIVPLCAMSFVTSMTWVVCPSSLPLLVVCLFLTT